MSGSLETVLLLLFLSVMGQFMVRRLKGGGVLAYMVVGILLGPFTFGVVRDINLIEELGHFGVMFLMFSIGLEFSLSKLKLMKKDVFGFGGTVVAFFVLLGLVCPFFWQTNSMSWQTGLLLGAAVAMSSTAIVLRVLSERIELETTHGQKIFAALLFQDLAVVPVFVLISVFADPSANWWVSLLSALSKALVIFFVLLYAGQKILSFWFTKIARTYSQELFSLNVLLVTLGLASLTEYFGLSVALGAFMAGVLLAETEHKHRVEVDIKPFRDIFLGLFFISVGMRLEPSILMVHWHWVVSLFLAFFLVKFLIISILAKGFRLSSMDSIKVGLGLAQVGEFGLTIVQLLSEKSLVSVWLSQSLLAAMVLSMFVTPLILILYDYFDYWQQKQVKQTSPVQAGGESAIKCRVLICGFGRSGQHLMRLLEDEGISSVVLDLNPDRVKEARNAGLNVFYADVTKMDNLLEFGLARVELVVLTFSDTGLSRRVLKNIKQEIPHLPVIVRTHDDEKIEMLYDSGATEVVPDTMEGGLMLGSHAMVRVGIPLFRVVKKVREVRDSGYALLRGFYGSDDADTYQTLVLHPIRLLSVMHLNGTLLKDLRAEQFDLEIVSLLREGLRKNNPPPETILKDNDILVVRGTKTAVAYFENSLTMR